MLLPRKIVHAFLPSRSLARSSFLLFPSPSLSLSGEKSDGRKKAAETDEEKGEAAAAAAFGDTGSSIRGERLMDMRPRPRPRPPSLPSLPLSARSPVPSSVRPPPSLLLSLTPVLSRLDCSVLSLPLSLLAVAAAAPEKTRQQLLRRRH